LSVFCGKVFFDFVDVVLVVAMHAGKVLLDVICPIELLVANVALERFLLPVNIFMPIIEVSSVRSVRAVWTDIPNNTTSAEHYILQPAPMSSNNSK
jgi:hypothetical protein